jgi:hypothetical protein
MGRKTVVKAPRWLRASCDRAGLRGDRPYATTRPLMIFGALRAVRRAPPEKNFRRLRALQKRRSDI